MNKRQLIVAWAILFSSSSGATYAYLENHPPYKFKDGAPKHLEVQPLKDLAKTESKYIADKKNNQTVFLEEVYRVDLDGNGSDDFIVFSSYRGCGLAGYKYEVEILLKKGDNSYQKISYDTMANNPIEEFVDLDKDGKYEVIITDLYYGDKHNYFTYNIYEFKDYKLVNADVKFGGFPKFVWITNKPNDKDTAHLTKEQRMALTHEKDNSIKYAEIKMNKKQLIIGWAMVFVSALPLFAQEKHPIDKFEEECISENQTTAGMANCTYEARKKWDAEMNKYYKLLMSVLDKNRQDKLRESQRAWIKFRDAEFENIENMYPQDATMYINVRAAAKMSIVKERALQLKDYYEIQEKK